MSTPTHLTVSGTRPDPWSELVALRTKRGETPFMLFFRTTVSDSGPQPHLADHPGLYSMAMVEVGHG